MASGHNNLASTLAAAQHRMNEAEEQAARAQAAGRRAISSTAGEFSVQEGIESVQVDAMASYNLYFWIYN